MLNRLLTHATRDMRFLVVVYFKGFSEPISAFLIRKERSAQHVFAVNVARVDVLTVPPLKVFPLNDSIPQHSSIDKV